MCNCGSITSQRGTGQIRLCFPRKVATIYTIIDTFDFLSREIYRRVGSRIITRLIEGIQPPGQTVDKFHIVCRVRLCHGPAAQTLDNNLAVVAAAYSCPKVGNFDWLCIDNGAAFYFSKSISEKNVATWVSMTKVQGNPHWRAKKHCAYASLLATSGKTKSKFKLAYLIMRVRSQIPVDSAVIAVIVGPARWLEILRPRRFSRNYLRNIPAASVAVRCIIAISIKHNPDWFFSVLCVPE